MFDYITNTVIYRDNNKKQTGGGSNDTEPYNTFHKMLDNTYDYLNYVFKNRKLNSEKYDVSIKNLDEKCDCEKYKCMKDTEPEVREEEPEEPVPIVLNKEPEKEDEEPIQEPNEEEPIQEPNEEEPKEEEPKEEEPKDEEPKDEEPMDEEPMDEEPMDEEPMDEEPKEQEPIQEPNEEEPKEEEPKRDLNKLLKKSDYIE